MKDMESFLPFFLGAAMFATLAVLVIGIISFAVHGKFYQRQSNNLMRLRVVFQAVALLFFAILMFTVAS
jgi:hypothetical protein